MKTCTAELTDLTDERIEELLLKRDNVLALEGLLYTESQKLIGLQKLKEEGKLDFGSMLGDGMLELLFRQVKEEVDEYFGTEGIPEPRLIFLYGGRYNAYGSKKRQIIFTERMSPGFIPIAIHEYTHYLQHVFHQKIYCQQWKYGALLEGHARGVERFFSYDYAATESNEAFIYTITDSTVAELKSAYAWMCGKLGMERRENLLTVKSTGDKMEELRLSVSSGKPSPHGRGNAFFYLLEAKKGNGIYRDILRGNLDFLKSES